MKRITFLVLGALLGALSWSLVSARDDRGAYRVVFTIPIETALATARKKAGTDFWESYKLAKAVNQLAITFAIRKKLTRPSAVSSNQNTAVIIYYPLSFLFHHKLS